jgi:hypothetical protein
MDTVKKALLEKSYVTVIGHYHGTQTKMYVHAREERGCVREGFMCVCGVCEGVKVLGFSLVKWTHEPTHKLMVE